ncbi:hypothetical protein Shyd_68680 [Streptomyces hydrogenans]|uniref:Uncharacterized protein n=1 Tax=Streptomyces hydrogenans TaxID=1873719 RepID=A0ABQ3PKE9_9ACTN|nr:hypothetical protein [Streptomyces hydrogenans]GHI25497.1 hypothetical protein Shyd_68680 [Streptomyces hydrogenans]
MRERPRGEKLAAGRAVARTVSPDMAAPTSARRSSHRTRINLHRKIVKHAAFTGQYPSPSTTTASSTPSNGPSPLDFLPYRAGQAAPGRFQARHQPWLVKHEGTQTRAVGEQVRRSSNAPELNLARFIKDGEITTPTNGE